MSDESEENGVGLAQQPCLSVLKKRQHYACNGVEQERLVLDENCFGPGLMDQ